MDIYQYKFLKYKYKIVKSTNQAVEDSKNYQQDYAMLKQRYQNGGDVLTKEVSDSYQSDSNDYDFSYRYYNYLKTKSKIEDIIGEKLTDQELITGGNNLMEKFKKLKQNQGKEFKKMEKRNLKGDQGSIDVVGQALGTLDNSDGTIGEKKTTIKSLEKLFKGFKKATQKEEKTEKKLIKLVYQALKEYCKISKEIIKLKEKDKLKGSTDKSIKKIDEKTIKRDEKLQVLKQLENEVFSDQNNQIGDPTESVSSLYDGEDDGEY